MTDGEVLPSFPERPGSPAELAEAVGRTGYLADEGLATVAGLAVVMRRPLMLEGEPGTGKTAGADLLKPPGVAESLDRARCLVELGRPEPDVETAAATLGAVCKYREDIERVRDSLDRLLAG